MDSALSPRDRAPPSSVSWPRQALRPLPFPLSAGWEGGTKMTSNSRAALHLPRALFPTPCYRFRVMSSLNPRPPSSLSEGYCSHRRAAALRPRRFTGPELRAAAACQDAGMSSGSPPLDFQVRVSSSHGGARPDQPL